MALGAAVARRRRPLRVDAARRGPAGLGAPSGSPRRAAPPSVALAAALLVAGSPPMLFQATRDDERSAGRRALGVGARLAAAPGMARHAAAPGVLAAVALAVRPNLVAGGGAVWLAALAIEPGRRCAQRSDARGDPARCRWRVAAAAVAAVNARLWGSPFVSGYGPASDISQPPPTSCPTCEAMWRWTLETRGYWTAAGLAARRRAGGARAAAARGGRRCALVAGVLASYLPYAQFVEWWYLRFYLPAWPVVAAACRGRRWRLAGALVAGRAAASLIAGGGAGHRPAWRRRRAQASSVFDLWRGEQRYADVGRWVDGHAGTQRRAPGRAAQRLGGLLHAAARSPASTRLPPTISIGCASGAGRRRPRRLARRRRLGRAADPRALRQPAARRASTGRRSPRRASARPRVHIYDLATPTRATGPALIAGGHRRRRGRGRATSATRPAQ